FSGCFSEKKRKTERQDLCRGTLSFNTSPTTSLPLPGIVKRCFGLLLKKQAKNSWHGVGYL
ncbi:hypothetical protein, partial [Rufibacter ruber]|uniref:hypothetical protein n=1 Tax=Rufibacter ruber TaxID=1783499 RepID=UPI0019D3C45C